MAAESGGARFAQPRLGERKKGFVVRLEGVGAEGLKRVAQLDSGVVAGPEPLCVDGAIFFELGLEAGLRRA